MKSNNTRFAVLGGALCILLSGTAIANDGFYAGVKAGLMTSDISGLDSGINLGLTGGHEWNLGEISVAAEGEFSTALSKGDVNFGEWDVETLALYGVVRTHGDLYLKAKMGFLREKVTIDTNFSGSFSETDSGASYGIGGGWNLGNGALELEYTIIEQDINFLSLGYNFRF